MDAGYIQDFILRTDFLYNPPKQLATFWFIEQEYTIVALIYIFVKDKWNEKKTVLGADLQTTPFSETNI